MEGGFEATRSSHSHRWCDLLEGDSKFGNNTHTLNVQPVIILKLKAASEYLHLDKMVRRLSHHIVMVLFHLSCLFFLGVLH